MLFIQFGNCNIFLNILIGLFHLDNVSMKIIILLSVCLFTISTIFSDLSHAQNIALSNQVEKRFITAYDKGFSSIIEFRKVNLSEGHNEIIIEGIPQVHDMGRFSIFLDGTFEKAKVSKSSSDLSSLFKRLEGNKVRLQNSDSSFDGNLAVQGATLLLENGERMYLTNRPQHYFLYPLEQEITLFGDIGLKLQVNANNAGEQIIALVYGTKQIGWTVAHSIRLHPQKLTYDWYAEAQIFNNSGVDFESTYLRLFSGEIDTRDISISANRKIRRSLEIYDELIDLDAFLETDGILVSGYQVSLRGTGPVQRVVFEDYFAYDFPEPVTLRNGAVETIKLHYLTELNYSTKNIAIIPASNQNTVPVTKTAIINEANNRIPYQMPEGIVYITSLTGNGIPLFEGQNSIRTTPPGLKTYLATGEYVPIEIEHDFNRTSTRRANSYDNHTITIKNKGKNREEFIMRRHFHNARTVVESKPDFFFKEGNYIMANISLEPDEELTFSLRFKTPPPP